MNASRSIDRYGLTETANGPGKGYLRAAQEAEPSGWRPWCATRAKRGGKRGLGQGGSKEGRWGAGVRKTLGEAEKERVQSGGTRSAIEGPYGAGRSGPWSSSTKVYRACSAAASMRSHQVAKAEHAG